MSDKTVNTWLVGDIGGTNARFGLVSPDGAMLHSSTLASGDFAEIGDAAEAYLAQRGAFAKPRVGALAIAAPIAGDRVEMTNHPWSFSIDRLRFDLRRVMRTQYHIDRYQETYFVINEFAELFAATRPDFAPIYREIAVLPEIAPDAVLPGERDACARTGKKEGPRVSTARV